MEKVKAGDCIAIPDANGNSYLGRVLFLSKMVRKAALIEIFHNEDLIASFDCADLSKVKGDRLIWTGRQSIEDGSWKKVGFCIREMGDSEGYFIVGGWLWRKDENIRPASKGDYERFPKMTILGEAAVQNICSSF